MDADQGRGLCALRLQRDHRRPRVRLDSRDRRRAAGHRHVLRYPLAPARRVPLRPDLCRGAEEHRPVRPGGGDRSRRPARPRPQRLPDHAQLQDRRGQRFHVQHPGDLLLVPVRPGLRMAEGAGRGDRDGAAQPRQEGPAVQDHRCQRLLHQPDPAERPLLDERAVPPGRRASRQAVPGRRRGARAAQPERPPLGRRHARFHLQRPWPGRGRGAGRIHGGVREGARLMADQDQLKALRLRIDSLDEKLLELISERARCAQDVARVKTQTLGEGEAPVFYRPEREAWVLKHIMQLNKGPLDNEEVARLFREIMSSCLALEQPLKVAYLGPEGTFTQAAALKHFGNAVISTPMAAIDEVFREVAAGAVNFGVVPVENSTEGAVNHTLDSFLEHDMVICGEVELRIHHHLLVGETTKTDNITRIYSHAQSLAQCRKWLDSHYPSVERVAVSSNADAAKRVKSEWNSAAIAGDMAASLYDLSKLHEKIEDRPDNSTRFLIIGNQEVPPTGDDKTSIIVSMRNKPGALHELLVPFHNNGIDLTRIETRPSRSGKWTYVFFIDFVGHHKEPLIKDVLEKIGQEAVALKVLGSYPKAVL
ncbi:P-protein [Pseudomonas aeruginosa MH27]|nr:P-protein [Pseudomonas aeruginosa MH27]